MAGFLGVFGYGLCYMFACGLLIYLRVKRPELERPFRCPLVPVIPAIGIVLYSLAIAFSGIQVIVVGVVWCAAALPITAWWDAVRAQSIWQNREARRWFPLGMRRRNLLPSSRNR